MTDSPHPPKENLVNNDRSVAQLAWAIESSVGQFKLILARCNYAKLRDRLIQRLREICQVEIRLLVMQQSRKTLYTEIREQFGENIPACVMVVGLETVQDHDLAVMLTSANQVREEFRKNFPFPLVLWIDDEIYKELMQVAPDLESWATTRNFAIATTELTSFLQQTAAQLFNNYLDINLSICAEIKSAWQDLQFSGQALRPDLKANCDFLLGLVEYLHKNLDSAIQYYHQSLVFWQSINNLERQGEILRHITLCYYEKARKNRSQIDILLVTQKPNLPTPFHTREGRDELPSHSRGRVGGEVRSEVHQQNFQLTTDWQATRNYLQQCLEAFKAAQRLDLVADSIDKFGIIMRDLQDWEQLQDLAECALQVHQSEGNIIKIAHDYGFLAEVALVKANWNHAKKLVGKALEILYTANQSPLTELVRITAIYHQQNYLLILALAQQHLDQPQEAINNLEAAKKIGVSEREPRLYLNIINNLQQLYFQQQQYLKAFEAKQERRSIEQQFGLRAFIGAGWLQATKKAFVQTLQTASPQENIAPEIAASGRQIDVERLLERIGRPDYKLIVIHGPSGVGKSSLVNAGLIPALKNKAIGFQDNLPIAMRVYTNWVEELGRVLGQGDKGKLESRLSTFELDSSTSNTQTPHSLLSHLRKNEQRNLRTVLIFDQFEEFFFVYTEPAQRKQFFEFLGECLNVLSLKVILSLRVDYIHYLLECNDLPSLKIIGNDILSNNVLYKLGNFSPDDAKLIIQRLTENANFRLEPTLVEQLVQDLAGELGEVRPIELQVVGAQLQTENITTLAEYQQRGTKEELVKRYLEEVVKDCGVENQQAAEILLYLLTDEKGTRPLKTRAELEHDLHEYFSVSSFSLSDMPPTPFFKGGLVSFTTFLRGLPKVGGAKVRGEQASEISKLDLILEIFVKSGLVVLLPENPADRYQLVHDYVAAFIHQQQKPKLKQVLAELEKERKQRKQSEDKLNLVYKSVVLASITAVFGFAWLASVALQSAIEANVQLINAINNSSEAFLASGQYPDALITALKASSKIKHPLLWIQNRSDIQMQTVLTLQQAVYLKPKEAKENRAIEVNTLEGHSSAVYSVAYSPNGQQLASASEDKTIKIWDVSSGKLLKSLTGHSSDVNSIAYSPNGQQLASASADKTIKIWDVSSGKLLKSLTGHSSTVNNSIAYSSNGKQLASASDDKTIKIWDVSSGKLLKSLTGHSSTVNSIAYSSNGKQLASASDDKTIKIWDVSSGKLLKSLTGHSSTVNSIAYSSNGKQLASASDDKTIKIWDVSSGKLLKTLTGHSGDVSSIAYSPNGQQLASASDDSTIKIWDVSSGKLLKSLTGHSSGVYRVAYSPNGQQLASASEDKTIKIWDVSSGKLLKSLTGHSSGVHSVAYSPNGQQLASASADSTIKIWDVSSGKLLKSLTGHSSTVNSIAYSSNGKQLASASDDKTIKIWDVSSGKLLKTLTGHSGAVYRVAYSPNGQQLASASDDSTIKIWDVSSGKLLKSLTGHSSGVYSVAYSPNGQQLASASEDKTSKIWDVSSGKLLKSLTGHSSGVISVAYSPNGQQLASASSDETIKIWDVSSGKLLKSLTGHSSGVISVAYSPNGQQLASASADNTIKIWDVSSGQTLKSLTGHSDEVISVAYSPNGQQLASASADKTIILWDLDFDNLLLSGCNLLNNYFIGHPEVLEELQSCQTPSRLAQGATVLVIQGENFARNHDINGAVEKFDKAQQWDKKLKFDSQTRGKELANQGKIESQSKSR